MERFRFRWSAEDINEGATWMALGLFFKCAMADNLAAVFDGSSTGNPFLIWLANVVFGLRIYYDFAGYSMTALGLARCLGIRLTLNFASPYCAASAGEFWRRWHITLSQWFRDYLYIPLGGGRVKGWAANILLVFAISGLWHGAGWGFVLWGGFHGVFLVANRLFHRASERLSFRLPTAVGWLLTNVAAFGAWLCFYETRTPVLWLKLQTLATPGAYTWGALKNALANNPTNLWVTACFLALSAGLLFGEWHSLRRGGEPYALFRRPVAAIALVVLSVLLAPNGPQNGFIYFAF
jgi:D-alanyl-lipoteichoic acid acyltransferase DltB (MBOAT superfamily)